MGPNDPIDPNIDRRDPRPSFVVGFPFPFTERLLNQGERETSRPTDCALVKEVRWDPEGEVYRTIGLGRCVIHLQ